MLTERTLDNVWVEIEATFVSEASAKWKRCLLYKEAREAHPSDNDFGAWLEEMLAVSPYGETIEKKSERARMIQCATYLTEEQYVALGGTKAGRLMTRIEDFQHFKAQEWADLVERTITENLSTTQLEEAIKELAANMQKKPKAVKETAKAKLIRLERENGQMLEALHYKNGLIAERDAIIAELKEGIVREPSGGAPGFTPAEKIGLFSTDPEMFELQARLVKSDFEYACSLFGHTPESAQDVTALRQAYTECKKLYGEQEQMLAALEAATKFVIATLRGMTSEEEE